MLRGDPSPSVEDTGSDPAAAVADTWELLQAQLWRMSGEALGPVTVVVDDRNSS